MVGMRYSIMLARKGSPSWLLRFLAQRLTHAHPDGTLDLAFHGKPG